MKYTIDNITSTDLENEAFRFYEDKITYCRSSYLEMFCKKGAFKNFSKFTGKHLCQTLFFNKVAGLY